MIKTRNLCLLLLVFSVTLIDLGYANPASAAPGPGYAQNLKAARALVDREKYKESLAPYSKALAQNPDNSDLLIEVARVTGWSGDNQKSAELYGKVLTVAPGRRNDVILPLGWQLLWANRAQESVPYFKEYLDGHPDDAGANLGMARALAAQKKPDEALGYYQKAIERDPSSIDAYYGLAWVYLDLYRFDDAEVTYEKILSLNPKDPRPARAGIARCHNLAGLHRQAAGEYSALLAQSGSKPEPDYQSEYAHAQYWAGYDELALQTLEGIPDRDTDFRDQLNRNLGRYPVEMRYDGADDSDGVRIDAVTLSGGIRLKPATVIAASVRGVRVSQNSQTIHGKTLLGQVTNRFGDIDSKGGTHWLTVSLGGRQYGDWDSFAWQISDKWFVSDKAHVYIKAGNEPVENITALNNEVLFTSGFVTVDYFSSPRTTLTGGLGTGRFDDGNVRNSALGKIAYKFRYNNPRVVGGVEARYFDDSKPEISRGYYNPEQYVEGKLFVEYSHDLPNDWVFYAKGGLGRYDESPGLSGDLYSYELSLKKDMKENGQVGMYVGNSKSSASTFQGQGNPSGYRWTYWGINYQNVF